jgi:hypothetical protein
MQETENPPSSCSENSCGCAANTAVNKAPSIETWWTEGTVETPAGPVPRAKTRLITADRLGTWKARWAIGRMAYTVPPGLYGIGNPTDTSPVFVSANYKLSFDRLRSQLDGLDGWLLVLDTDGINVWCAAGKGTFGTDELVRRAESARLAEIVSHKKLIVPQLGAPGVSAHEVKHRTGFSVVYGPVRAENIPAFLNAEMKATPEMRRVRFPLRNRIALIPVEIVTWLWYVLGAMVIMALLSGVGPDIYSPARILSPGLFQAALLFGVFLSSAILTPALLPWLPGRAFSVKGAWIGLVFFLAVYIWHPQPLVNVFSVAAWLFLAPAIASFVAMNFTGASTYTSLSGVLREIRIAARAQITVAVIGLILLIAGQFV